MHGATVRAILSGITTLTPFLTCVPTASTRVLAASGLPASKIPAGYDRRAKRLEAGPLSGSESADTVWLRSDFRWLGDKAGYVWFFVGTS